MFALATYTQDAGLFTTFHETEEAALLAAAADALELAKETEDLLPDSTAISMFINDHGIDYQFQVTKIPG